MIRNTAGVLVGLLAWIAAATLFNLAMRLAWPDYAAAEVATTFTLAMLGGRLLVGALSSVCAGYTTAWIARGSRVPVNVLATMLLLWFIPIHYTLWNTFPLWYHAVFLASLVPLTLLGARWRASMASPASSA